MVVEVINTGTELLLGNTVNTHIAFLGQELFPLGLRVARQVTVPDGDAIRTALTEAMDRAEIIIVTGGLGPTTDDITREIVAAMFDLPLVEDPAVWEHIQARFARRGLSMTPRNRRQAQAPQGARVLPNPFGTAPGLYLLQGGRHIFLMPGPPRELKPMFRDTVAPILREIVPGGAETGSRRWLITGMGESGVEAAVGAQLLAIPRLELGYCARPGIVEVRCIGPAEALALAETVIMEKLSPHIAGEGSEGLEEILVHRLAELGKKVTTAESCTGGRLAHKITGVPGASRVFDAGFITYANEEKTRALGVSADLIAAHGAVSEPVARAMAEGALERAGADFALATTGIAGPDGGTPEKPVGTVYIAIASRGGQTRVSKNLYPMDRLTFQEIASNAALDMLRSALS
ncbi:MAG TPA: competence/damage-inducible protein A [Chthoniobacteraceae bacterium]|jgi:nicotinamide-nucleotide amidase|nr:competence/damage-inducible protein A [Chthoniobacteraceae bacterium]